MDRYNGIVRRLARRTGRFERALRYAIEQYLVSGECAMMREWSVSGLLWCVVVCAAIGGAFLWVGESGSYWRAYRYLSQHRRSGEMLFSDVSSRWMKPSLDATVLEQGIDLSPSRLSRVVWVLEHKRTGIRRQLPASLHCGKKRSFGLLKQFAVRRCRKLHARYISLRSLLRRAHITRSGKPCRWHYGACLFTRRRSWQRVEHRPFFKVAGTNRSCIYAHPYTKRWLVLQFPQVRVDEGARIGFGFQDDTGSKTPLRVKVTFQPKGQRERVLLDVTIPHRSEWYRHFFSSKQLGGRLGILRFRLWTKHQGAKSFCLNGALLQALPVRRPAPRLQLLKTGKPI